MVNSRKSKRILIVRLDRIGDVLLSTPVIKALRDTYPDSHIAFMARPYARDIIEGNPYLNELIIYDMHGEEKGVFGNLKFISALRKKRYDLALILHPTRRTHLITFLAGIPERIGYDKKWGFLLTKRIPHTKQFGLKHEIAYTLDLLKYLRIVPNESTIFMPIKPECERKIEGIFSSNGIKKTDTVVVINPSASCPSKRWHTKNFAAAADGLVEKYRAKVIIISGSGDRAFGDGVAALMKRTSVNLSGGTTVGDLGSILTRASLFISNDSGPVHIACAVGTPVVAIFGRHDRGLSPERWGPSGKNDIVLHKDVGCDVCHAHHCKQGFRCLEAINVDEVLAAADKIIKSLGKQHPEARRAYGP